MSDEDQHRQHLLPSQASQENYDIYLKQASDQLLTKQEKLSESFIKEFLNDFEQNYGAFNNVPADLSMQEKLNLIEKKLNDCSIILGHKFTPVLKEFIRVQFDHHLNQKYGIIENEMESDIILSEKYEKCFSAYINDVDSVSFAVSNYSLLKNIDIKDYFTLMFYAFATTKRQSGDNCLSLLISGRSSCGKTALFESPLQEVCHNFSNESGVGRFIVHSKSVLLLHDVPIRCLVASRDVDKLKAIARTEPISVKVHSRTVCLPPLFLCATSNQTLFSHRFAKPERKGINFRTFYRSDVEEIKSKKIHSSDIIAIQKRYLEMYVRQRPPLHHLPKSGYFKRKHLICGLYPLVLDILKKTKKSDYGSDMVYLYSFIALCKNNIEIINLEQKNQSCVDIISLFSKFELTHNQKSQCLVYLDFDL